jgi:hypothetical protein
VAEATERPSSPEQSKPSASDEKDEASFARTTLPYVIGALLAAVAMAWYFFVFVPAKLDYFVGLRFRTLAVASGHVASKIDDLARGLGSVPQRPPALPKAECGNPTKDVKTSRAKYVSLVLPEIQLTSAGRLPAGPRFSACDVSGSVAWTDVATQAAAASRRDFDDLVIADANGDIVWQREISTPRIGNLSELLGTTEDAGSWLSLSWRERATMPAKKDVGNLRSSAILKIVNLGGSSSVLFVQAVTLKEKSIVLSNTPTDQATELPRLYVAGLLSRATLQQQARRIPAAWVVLIALPIMLLFLAIPLVKLRTLTIKERYRFTDLVLLILATVAGAGLGAMIPFVAAPPDAPDAMLERLARAISSNLEKETEDVLRLADIIQRDTVRADPKAPRRARIEDKLASCYALGSGLATVVKDTQGRSACGFWGAFDQVASPTEKAGLSIDLDVVIWFDETGRQIKKWTTKRQVTGPTTHRPFDHYRAVTTNRLWTLADTKKNQRQFMIDPLRAPTTAELGVVFVTPTTRIGEEQRAYLALNVRPQSVVDPLVPPGYGFAIIAPSGNVLFHSEEGLSLHENFFEEVGDPGNVRQIASSNRVAQWSGDYHGRPHRFRLQPFETFRDSPWLIVTFQEVVPVLSRELLQQTGTLRLGALNLILLVLAALLLGAHFRPRHQRARDFMQTMLSDMPAKVHWIWTLPLLVVVELWAIYITYGVDAPSRLDFVYGMFVVIPVLSLLVVSLARTRPKPNRPAVPRTRREEKEQRKKERETRERYRYLAVAEPLFLVLIIGALPAIGFARVVHVARQTQDTERWVELAQQQWAARQARVIERLNGPNFSEELEARVANDFGAGQFGSSGQYTYLNVFDRLQVFEPDTPDPAPDMSVGQRRLRWLLEWNLFGSSDKPVDMTVRQATTSHVLRVAPVAVSGLMAGTSDDGSSRPSLTGIVLGASIFFASLAGVYWGRRKLQSCGVAAAPSLEDTIQNPKDERPIVLLIGPARTEKDEAVRRVVEDATDAEPFDRIRLLDDKQKVNKEYLDKEVARVTLKIRRAQLKKKLPNPFWIHVSNLETQLVDQQARTNILNALDQLRTIPRVTGCGVVVTSTVDPIEHFEEIFIEERKGIYRNPVPEVALNRSVLTLSFFRRCYMPISPKKDRLARCRDAWESWWRYKPSNWRDTLKSETSGFGPLDQVRLELESAWKHRDGVPYGELLRTIRSRATAYYEMLWTSCARSEKLVLIQLAQEGFVTTQSADVVAPLIAKGIIVERPMPAIFNRTFRDFLLDIERDDVVQRWERGEGHGLWVVAGRLIGSSVILGLLFFLLTQDVSVQSLLPVVSGTGLFGIPLVRAILARLAGKTAESA